MTQLKFYRDENERHPELRNAKVSPGQIKGIVTILCNEFKFPKPTIKFQAKRVGHCHFTESWLDFPKKPGLVNALLVVHELAHYYTYCRWGWSKHVKKMHKVVDMFAEVVHRYYSFGLGHTWEM